MKYRFNADVTFEASSEEDAITKLGSRLRTIGRHIGNGKGLADNKPFFSLDVGADAVETTDVDHDPIVAAELAAKPQAEASEAAEEQPASPT